MNIKRAIGFSVALYIVSFIGFFLAMLLPMEISMTEAPTLSMFVVGWIINIPAVLLLAKWYFKKVSPTTKQGVYLGITAIVVALLFDGMSVLGAYAAGESLDMFVALYTDWKLYATILEVILLATYAGYEFDATYTSDTN